MSASPLRISTSMLRDTLSMVTVGWFDTKHLPPATVEGYQPLIEEMGRRAADSGDLPWLLLGLRHVLATPSIEACELVNTRFAYSEREARDLLSYVVATLGTESSTALPPVVLEEMETEAWRVARNSQAAPVSGG